MFLKGIFAALPLMYSALRPLLVQSVQRSDTQFDDAGLAVLDRVLGPAEYEGKAAKVGPGNVDNLSAADRGELGIREGRGKNAVDVEESAVKP